MLQHHQRQEMHREGKMKGKGKRRRRNSVSRARRIAGEMIMTLTMKQEGMQRREEDDRWKNKIMMTMISASIRNSKMKSAEFINNSNKRQPPAKYFHHGRMCRVGKHATRAIERWRWSSTMVRTSSATPEEAWDGILPYDIMATNILPRLHVKLLARLRCVCKQWRSLTYDPRFAMEQLMRGADAHPASTSLCMLTVNFVPMKQKTLLYNLIGLDGSGNGFDGDREIIEDVSFDFRFRSSGWYMLSNSVNGLICALCQNHVGLACYPYLINPTTREGLPLPELSCCLDFGIRTVSLGFDSSSGRYTVVCSNLCPPNSCTFHVLTVGSRDWRRVTQIQCWVRQDVAVFLDGALHWRTSKAILAFDIKDERFRFIPTPDMLVSQGIGRADCLALWMLKGHLCLVVQPEAPRRGHGAGGRPFLILWKLEDAANAEWTRVCDIDMTGCVDDELDGSVARVVDEVCGKILIKWGPRLYSYDEGSKTLNLITECLPGWRDFDVFTPSLVSPIGLPALL